MPRLLAAMLAAIALYWLPRVALAHGVELEPELPASSEYFGLGVTHILGGIDHLLFLAGLVLIGGRIRDLLAAVSAFTLAHSITLAASVFELVTPPATLIEVLIALSVAYVGVENLVLPNAARGRWRLTFAFGLIHGFGFASALRDLGVPIDRSAAALICFNLGVEAGQLAVLGLCAPILLRLGQLPRVRSFGVPALSASLAAIGLVWAVSRTLAPEPAVASDRAAPVAPTAIGSAAVETEAPSARSTYPDATGSAQPWVEALCTAFHELPRARRAECTGRKPAFAFTAECARMLNAAVESGALRVEPTAAQSCIAAQRARFQDCGFARAIALPPLPECGAVLQGTISRDASCRSSLECEEGLHCLGVSPLDTGSCQPPAAEGTRCGLVVDPLASYVVGSAARHRECAGDCVRGSCQRAQ